MKLLLSILLLMVAVLAGAQTLIPPGTVFPHTVMASNLWDRSNVKYWGARGDGVTDDTAAIQATINNVTNAGGLVHIPAGAYSITTLIVGGAGVRISGVASADGSVFGSQGSVLLVQGANYGIVIGDRTNDVQYNFAVENLSIVGTASGKAGIRVGTLTAEPNNAVSRFLIDNVTVSGFTGSAISHTVATGEPAATGACGIFLARGVTGTIKDVYCMGNYIGLLESSDHRATTVAFDACSFRANTIGVRITSAVQFTFSGCVFESNDSMGFDAIGNSSIITFLSLNQCYFEGNGLTTATQEMRVANANNVSLRDININATSNNIPAVYLTNVLYGLMENVTQQAVFQVNVQTTNCTGLLAYTRAPGSNPVYSSNHFDFNGTTEVRTETTGGQSVYGRSFSVRPTTLGQGYLKVYNIDNTVRMQVGVHPAADYITGIWLGDVVPAAGNFAVMADTDNTLINAVTSLGDVRFGIGGTTYALLKADGRFGIGTLNPSSSLDVTGQVRAVSAILTNRFGFGDAAATMAFTTTNGHGKVTDGAGALTGATNALWFQGANNFTQGTNAFANQQSGKVNMEVGHSFYYVTNSLVTTNSILLATLNSAPDSERLVAAVPLAGVIRLDLSAPWTVGGGGNISWFIVAP